MFNGTAVVCKPKQKIKGKMWTVFTVAKNGIRKTETVETTFSVVSIQRGKRTFKQFVESKQKTNQARGKEFTKKRLTVIRRNVNRRVDCALRAHVASPCTVPWDLRSLVFTFNDSIIILCSSVLRQITNSNRGYS